MSKNPTSLDDDLFDDLFSDGVYKIIKRLFKEFILSFEACETLSDRHDDKYGDPQGEILFYTQYITKTIQKSIKLLNVIDLLLNNSDSSIDKDKQKKVAFWFICKTIQLILDIKQNYKYISYKKIQTVETFNKFFHTFLWKSYYNINQQIFNKEYFLLLDELYINALIVDKNENNSPLAQILDYWKDNIEVLLKQCKDLELNLNN